MGRRIWIVIAWLAIIAGLAMPAFAQTVEQDKSSLYKGLSGVYIVDDNDAGFQATIADQTTDWPFADSVCDFEAIFKTSYRQPYHIPLGLVELSSMNVKRGDPFGSTVHWTAQYKPSPGKYFLDNHDMGVQDANLWHNVAKWVPNLTGAGLGTGCYEVWVYIPWNTTEKAQYTVRDAFGTSSAIAVRQYGVDRCTDPRNKWVRLDSTRPDKLWRFNKTGADQWVQLDDQTGETGTNGLNCIVYDAVAFKKVSDPANGSITVYARCDKDNNKCIDPATEKDPAEADVSLYLDSACSGTPVGSCRTDKIDGKCTIPTSGLLWNTTYYAKETTGPTPPTTCTTYKITLTECAQDAKVYVPVQCTGSITVCKIKDCNLSGGKDGTESGVPNWPIKLTGTKADGTAITPIYAFTGSDGCYTFDKLDKGTYTVTEEASSTSQLQWQKVQQGTSYNFIGTWNGGKWLSTNPTATASGPNVPTIGPISISAGDNKTYTFFNVPLTTVTVNKFLDLNLSGICEPNGETFTDQNNNGKWDLGEAFTDADNDKCYDYPECSIGNWPIKITGKRADGTVITFSGMTNASGVITFDMPPSDATGYTLSEELPWVNFGTAQNPIWRTTYTGAQINCVCGSCPVERWQATTAIEQKLVLTCGQEARQIRFGNVCLTNITGIKLMSDDPECLGTYPGAGVKMNLMGKDHLGRDISAYYKNNGVITPCNLASQTPPPPAGHVPAWYETTCDANGCFNFVDVLPGHYHLTDVPGPGRTVKLPPNIVDGFEMVCCPLIVPPICNPTIPPPGEVYQVDAGDSRGTEVIWAGYKPPYGDAITALPGVFAIDPGNNWDNFKKTHGTSITTTNREITLTKDFGGFVQCGDIFTPVHITQSGASNIRRWWPLMYEPPTTTWTLALSYLTDTAVQLPGESAPNTVHSDTWRWTVTTDIPHMILYLDLLHEVPFGKDEVPLISNEPLYKELRALLVRIKDAIKNNDMILAGQLLGEFDWRVGDACIGASPMYPNPTGADTGIANTDENPACCKLMVDTEYVGKIKGIWKPE